MRLNYTKRKKLRKLRNKTKMNLKNQMMIKMSGPNPNLKLKKLMRNKRRKRRLNL